MKTMRYISLFSGIEAASVAWGPLGWDPVAFSEIEPFPCAVLSERFPNVPNLGDITKVDWREYAGSVDVVVGGSPCQSFSVAGKREGLAGESGLMFEYIRAVRELMPKYFVWENVPGALSSEGGAAFGQLLREMDDLGYGLAWRVLDAQFFGVAQRRRRVFLVGCLGDAKRAAEILFEHESLRWDYPSSRAKREELAAAASCCAGRRVCGSRGSVVGSCGEQPGCLNPWDHQSKRVFDQRGPYQTLYAHGSGGHDDGAVLAFDTTQITSPANGCNPQYGDPCHPLCANAHVPTIAFSAGQSPKAGSLGLGEEIAPTLRSGSSGTNQVPTIVTTQFGDEIAGTLTARADSSPCVDRGQNIICMASSQANAEKIDNCCTTQTARQYKDATIVSDGMIVRRLMPIECERLQCFPDDWTRIPYRGKSAEECPDTPRYKAIGNSMALPVMRWIGERIAMVDALGGQI